MKEELVRALDPSATKLARIKALMHAAPEPSIHGLQERLFSILAEEDFALAADIIIDGFQQGTVPSHFLTDCIEKILDPEQLRKAVGVLAADARECLSLDMLEDSNAAGIDKYIVVAAAMKRLVAARHRVWEVRELADAVLVDLESADRAVPTSTDTVSQIRGTLEAMSSKADIAPSRPAAFRPSSDSNDLET